MTPDLKPGVTNSQTNSQEKRKTPGVRIAHPAVRRIGQRLLY
jgi:hypothetical protein